MTENHKRDHGSIPRRMRRWLWILAISMGGLIWIGSLRLPADLTQPLVLSRPARNAALDKETLKIGVFNIHGCKGRDGRRDVARVANAVTDLDLLSLHEVRGGYFDNQAHELGRRLDMAALFAPTEWRWGRNDFGNGLLTKVQLQEIHQIPQIGASDAHRNALLTSFQFGGKSVRLLIAHLDLTTDRDRQISSITDIFMSLKSPAILMGDLNCKRSHPRIKELLREPGVRNALSASRDNRRDWIITEGLTALSSDVIRNEASDHPLVVAELVLNREPESDRSKTSKKRLQQAAKARDKN